MPDGKKVTDVKWLSIYDLTFQVMFHVDSFILYRIWVNLHSRALLKKKENFGDVFIDEGFEPPSSQKLTELSRRAHRVSSLAVVIVDAKTVLIPEFNYDGLATGKWIRKKNVICLSN